MHSNMILESLLYGVHFAAWICSEDCRRSIQFSFCKLLKTRGLGANVMQVLDGLGAIWHDLLVSDSHAYQKDIEKPTY